MIWYVMVGWLFGVLTGGVLQMVWQRCPFCGKLYRAGCRREHYENDCNSVE